jgi:hypothetical protein
MIVQNNASGISSHMYCLGEIVREDRGSDADGERLRNWRETYVNHGDRDRAYPAH